MLGTIYSVIICGLVFLSGEAASGLSQTGAFTL